VCQIISNKHERTNNATKITDAGLEHLKGLSQHFSRRMGRFHTVPLALIQKPSEKLATGFHNISRPEFVVVRDWTATLTARFVKPLIGAVVSGTCIGKLLMT